MHESDSTEPTTASGAPAAPAAESSTPVLEATATEAAAAEAPAAAEAAPNETPPPAEPVAIEPEPAAPVPEPAAEAVQPPEVVPIAEAAPPAEAPPSPEAARTAEPEPGGAAAAPAAAIPAPEAAPQPSPVAAPPPAEELPPVAAVATVPAEVAPAPAQSAPAAAAFAAPVAEGAPAADGAQAPASEVVAGEPVRKPPPPPNPANEERRLRAQQAWERVVAARESGEVLTGTVTTAVKGGLLVDVGGIRGFLPASQVRTAIGTSLETLVKMKVPLKVIDIDQARRRIVVSNRRAADEERRAKRTELLRSLEVGQVREGVVVRLADFGAFVDLGGVDGLIPMRELAFERVEKSSDVVKVGEVLSVEVLRIDENGKKISLSRKNALPDPWRDHANVLRQGSTVEGKVVGKEPRLQVEIAPGIVGSIREGDADPADYEVGESIEVLVRRVDRATRRITLTTLHGAAAVPPPSSTGFAPLGVELGRRS